MIVKEKDYSIAPQIIRQLETLLEYNIDSRQRRAITEKLKFVRSGIKGEKESAYFIDFHYGQSKDWMVLHDLRFEHEGTVAQIDHLLINRLLEIYVLESKNYANGVEITEYGEFRVFSNGKSKAIESPIEQNKRHIFFLKKYFKKIEGIFPRRLGIAIQPALHSYVMISPKSKVIRPPKTVLDTSVVIKSDALYSITQELDALPMLLSMSRMGKVIGCDTLHDFARKLSRLHKKPPSTDYKKQFGITSDVGKTPVQPAVVEETTKSDRKPSAGQEYFCAKCKKTITSKVARFCFNDKRRFGGRAYCYSCQESIKQSLK